MNKKYKKLILNTSVLAISNFSSKILVFLLVPLYTSVLTTEEYGQYDLVISTIQLFIPLLSLNIADGVMRFLMDKQKDEKEVLVIGVKYINIAVLLIGFFLLLNYWCCWFENIKAESVYIFFLAVVQLWNQFLVQAAKGMEKVQGIAKAGILNTLVTVVCMLVFLLVLPIGLKGFYLSYIIGIGMSVLYLTAKIGIKRLVPKKANHAIQKEMIVYSAPLILTSLGWWANSLLDRYFVTGMCGIAENGLYSVSYKIPGIITTIQTIFMQAWQISAIQEYGGEESENFYKQTFVYLNMIMVLGSSGIILAVNFLAKILFANEFFEAWRYVPFLLISAVFNAASGYIGAILAAKKRSKPMATSAIFGIVTNVVQNAILISYMGTQGAAIATAVSSMVIFIVRMFYAKEVILGKRFLRIIVSWCVLIIQSALRSSFGFRMEEIFCIGLILLLYCKEILFFGGLILQKVKRG